VRALGINKARKEFRMPVIKAGAFDLDYTDTGSGPPVVLVHSSASASRQWRQLTELLQSRYRVIAINLFGYGKTSAWPGSPWPGSPWPGKRPLSAADEAGLVAAAAALASSEPVALVGHSLGGAVVLEAAAMLADRVRLVVAFEPILFGYLREHGPADAYQEIAELSDRYGELAKSGDWNAAGQWFVDYWSGAGTWTAMSDERKQNTMAMLPPVLHEWDMATSGIRPLDGWRAITAPVHLISAADTRAPTRAIVELLAKTYPDWQVHEVPSGGHMAPLARPDLVNPLIAGLLDGR
jgi:pimeloyl-ACP methyl ester carboxylesterase